RHLFGAVNSRVNDVSSNSTHKDTNTKANAHTEYFQLPDVNDIPRTYLEGCKVLKPFRVFPHLLGEGSYGRVMVACKDGERFAQNCKQVAKLVSFDKRLRYPRHYLYDIFFAECLMTEYAGKHGFGVPLYAYGLCHEDDNIFGSVEQPQHGGRIFA